MRQFTTTFLVEDKNENEIEVTVDYCYTNFNDGKGFEILSIEDSEGNQLNEIKDFDRVGRDRLYSEIENHYTCDEVYAYRTRI